MLHISFLFMGNLRFGERVGSETFIMEEGYLPLLDLLAAYPEVKSEICCSGYTTERCRESCPDVIAGVRAGIEKGRLHLSTNGFEHVYLPTLSVFSVERLISLGVAVDKEVFGCAPTGFFPSDLVWDSTAVKTLRENGIRWVYVPSIGKSNPGGPYYNDWKTVDRFLPFRLLGAEQSSIINVPGGTGNYDLLGPQKADRLEQVMTELEQRAASGRDGLFLFGMDLETLAVFKSPRLPLEDGQQRFASLMERLLKMKGARFSFVDDFLNDHAPVRDLCLREPLSVGLGGWHNGCLKLADTCRRTEDYLLDVEDRLAARPEQATPEVKQALDSAWRSFLFSMQSDIRMTNLPHQWDWETNTCEGPGMIYPTDRMVLNGINDALAAMRQARDLRRRLL